MSTDTVPNVVPLLVFSDDITPVGEMVAGNATLPDPRTFM